MDNFPNKKLEEVWDFEKNSGLDPWNISRGSKLKKYWFICQEKDYHGSYEIKCNDFSGGHRCSYCSTGNGKVHPKDSVGQYIIDNYGEEFLWSIWSSKNEKSPFEYKPRCQYNIWWKCPNGKHEDYERNCDFSNDAEFRCPKCVEEMNNSIIENKTKSHLYELGYSILTEHNCTIKPINPKTGYPLPYDNEIVLENGKHLIIEVHGEQHYKLMDKNSKFLNKNETPEEYLYKRKLYDRYKRIKCKQAGYEYLELPYWAFEGKNKNKYKQIIDNTINEMLNDIKK